MPADCFLLGGFAIIGISNQQTKTGYKKTLTCLLWWSSKREIALTTSERKSAPLNPNISKSLTEPERACTPGREFESLPADSEGMNMIEFPWLPGSVIVLSFTLRSASLDSLDLFSFSYQETSLPQTMYGSQPASRSGFLQNHL